jgi:hypothetical protein
MRFFFPHIILGVGKQRDLGNKICQTVEDALNVKSTPRSTPPAVCFSAVTYTEEQATIAVPPDPPNHHRLQRRSPDPQTCSSWSLNPAIYCCRRRSPNLGNDLFLLSISKHHQHCHPGDPIILAFFLWRSSEQCTCSSRSPKPPSPASWSPDLKSVPPDLQTPPSITVGTEVWTIYSSCRSANIIKTVIQVINYSHLFFMFGT